MKTIKCVNSNGQSAEFTYNHDSTEFFLVSLDGMYEVKNTVNTSRNATTDGETYSGEALEKRNIVITANIIRNYRKNRDYLSRVFKIHSEGTLYHEEQGEIRKINYYVESVNIEEKGIIRAAVISLICPNPYFRSDEQTYIEMAGWENCFEFALEISEEGMEFAFREKETIKIVDNDSTTSIGIKMTIKAEDTVKNPLIMNLTTGENLKLLCTMEANDRIIITTEQGNIDVILVKGGKEYDYNYTVDEENEGYIQLETGRNHINYTAEEGEDFMNVAFEFEEQYVMP